jgi:parvulin-like peptidyl-prolyl isomerase
VGAKQGQSRKSAGRQRLALIVFAAVFVVLFAGFAIAQGIGQPSVPAGDVALVQNVPSDISHISEAEFKKALLQQVAQGGLKKVPSPGGKKYEELKKAALGELLDAIWIQGEGEELGISVTQKQIATELAQIKEQNFKEPGAYAKFLKTSHFTPADVNARVKLQLLSTQIQEQITKGAPPASSSEIEDYYNASKATQFTTKPTRDVRIVVNKDKAKAAKAKAELAKDDSANNWKKVVGESSSPSAKAKGGLSPGISEELLKGALKGAIFGSATNEVVGPVNYEGSYFVVEVVKLNPEKVQTLGEVRSQISTQLTQQTQQTFFSEFVSQYQSKWTSRTFCASDFKTERCANYVGSGHPSSAPPGCYEANPKGVPPKECPAPITFNTPALPGTTTVIKPQGERLVQRPQPEGLKESAEGEVTLPEGATPGATEAPPTGG